MRRFAIALLFAAVASAAPRSEACSPPSCNESWSAPKIGGTIPANAPAIVFVEGAAPYWDPLAKPGPPTLKTASGETIATTRDGTFLRPTAPLPIGAVTLAWDEICRPPGDAGSVPKSLTFNVVEAAPLPSALGAVTVAYAREKVTITTSAGSCTDVIDAAVARFAIVLDPSLAKFSDVASITARVDGAAWGSTAWGRVGPVATPTYGMDSGAHRHDVVFAACGPSPYGTTDRGVAEGKHVVELRAEIAGGPPIAAVSFEIELRCGGSTPDGGSVRADAAAADATDSGSGAAPRETATAGGGCVVGRNGPSGAAAVISALALAFRRRRGSLDTPRGGR